MPPLSRLANFHWAQYEEALEAITHGNRSHGLDLCYDLIIQPEPGKLLKSLIYLTLATETDLRRHPESDKIRWIEEAQQLHRQFTNLTEADTKAYEHVRDQIAAAREHVRKQVSKAQEAALNIEEQMTTQKEGKKNDLWKTAKSSDEGAADGDVNMSDLQDTLAHIIPGHDEDEDDDDRKFEQDDEEEDEDDTAFFSPQTTKSDIAKTITEPTLPQIPQQQASHTSDSESEAGALFTLPTMLKKAKFPLTPIPSSDPNPAASDGEDK